jgi:transposase
VYLTPGKEVKKMPSKAKERLQTGQAASDAAEATSNGSEDPNEKPVRTLIREAWAAGKSRSEIAKEFGVTYQRVFSLTRDTEGGPADSQGRARVMVEASTALTEAGREDLVGMTRVDAARKLFEEGLKVGAIAKLLGTSYQIIYQATAAKAKAAADGEDAEDQETAEDEPEDEEEDSEDDGEPEEGEDEDEEE